MQLQIADAEGSLRASSISGSLMLLSLNDKNSDIKSWLEQGEEADAVFRRSEKSQKRLDMSKADKALSPQRSKPSVPVQTGTQPNISKLKVTRSLTHEQNPSVKPKQVVNKASGTLPPLGFEEFNLKANSNSQNRV